jgi:hypothetical protein
MKWYFGITEETLPTQGFADQIRVAVRAAARVIRDRLVVDLSRRGITQPSISERLGISVARVRSILARERTERRGPGRPRASDHGLGP